jgi:hypothetical protein
MDLVMGAAPRQRREPTGLCLVEIDSRRDQAGKRVDHYVVRYLERLPPGTSFPAMAQRFGEVAAAVSQRTGSRPLIYVDATGYGQPFINEVKRAGSYTRVRPVFFTHGDRRIEEGGEVRLGKCWLVTQVQMLLQTHQLHLPRSPEAERLAEELADYEVQVAPDANDRYGHFQVGTQDELVTALGLAVQRPPSGRVGHAWIRM